MRFDLMYLLKFVLSKHHIQKDLQYPTVHFLDAHVSLFAQGLGKLAASNGAYKHESFSILTFPAIHLSTCFDSGIK